MKTFLKILSISLIISLFVMNLSFAKEFTDVKGSKFEGAVDLLSSLNIINGYEDGTYKPNNTVTRAEMAKLIIVALGKDSTAASLKGDTKFSDVKADGWAAGYVNCASSLEIIKGYPDGTFKPSNTVTYAEASTMLLRALNYNKELESLDYPTGYMTVANKAGILENVTANSSSEAANRGNIAIMVLNTLKSGVRKIVSTTTKGVITYGDGSPLIESSFPDIQFIKEGEIVDIDYTDNEIYIRDKANSRRISATLSDTSKIYELFRRKVNCLYNKKDDKFLSFEIADDYKLEVVDVYEIDDDTIYDDDNNEYELPDDDDIIMAYISNYDDVETAYLVMEGKKVISAVLTGTPKLYIGLVTEIDDVQVDKRKGFEIITPEDKYKEYALNNTSEKIKLGAVVIFSLNNKDYAMIQEKIYENDALSIESLTANNTENSIQLKKKNKVTFAKDTEYYVYIVNKDTIREAELKDVEKEFDLAELVKFADVYYLIVFEDSVDADDIVSTLSVTEAREKLNKSIKKANTYLKKESSYSVETYEALAEAVDEASDALDGSASAAKLELLDRKITQAISGLKSSNSEDKAIRKDWDELQDIIKEAEKYKSSDYTSSSYSKLTTALKNAKAISLSNTTKSKIETAIENLEKAINLLVTKEADEELQSAIGELRVLISDAEAIYKNKSQYTDSSISNMYTNLTRAKKLDTDEASLREINTQISNLEAAINALVKK